MERLDLAKEIQTELFERWKKNKDDWPAIRAELAINEITMKILRRIASG